MTAPFVYPKSRHIRSQQPGSLATYKAYKPFLQSEFARKCVYCRMPDTLKGYDGFGVDHYRPKKKFPKLATTYSNLFYCCNQCNRRKGQYWPASAREATHFIPNPCDHAMFSHLQFERTSVKAKSSPGAVALECLDLNDDASVGQRELLINMIELAERTLAEVNKDISEIRVKATAGVLNQAKANAAIAAFNAEALQLKSNLAKLRGE